MLFLFRLLFVFASVETNTEWHFFRNGTGTNFASYRTISYKTSPVVSGMEVEPEIETTMEPMVSCVVVLCLMLEAHKIIIIIQFRHSWDKQRVAPLLSLFSCPGSNILPWIIYSSNSVKVIIKLTSSLKLSTLSIEAMFIMFLRKF